MSTKARKSKVEAEPTGRTPLEDLALSMCGMRDEWVRKRAESGVERRWLEDMAHYNGRDISGGVDRVVDTARKAGGRSAGRNANAESRSRVFVNKTRPKTNTATARIANMLFPVDEKNYGVSPTPVPSLMQELRNDGTVLTQNGAPIQKEDGTPLTAKDEAERIVQDARKRAKGMEDEINDQLTECQYNAQGRLVIADAVRLGTGVMKGPIIRGIIEKGWRRLDTEDGSSVYEIAVREKQVPVSVRVSCWDVFPDPSCGNNPHDGQGIWERSRLTARALRDLSRVEGYNKDAIIECLREPPQRTMLYDAYEAELLTAHGIFSSGDKRYECWTYTGDVSRTQLEAVGIQVADGAELANLSAVVVIVNGRAIKVHLNPLDTGDIPYDFFRYEDCEGSPWGYGVPYLMRTGQRIVNAAWRQTMDNAGATVGPQVVIKRERIAPANDDYSIRGLKLWYADEDVNDVRDAMAVFDIPSRVQELMEIIRFAEEFIDDETSLPMLLQGEKGTAPDTVGGMTMLLNSANEVLRAVAKRFDDNLTTPHIRRYYDYNMQYSPKEEIKGDLQVDARGTSALVVRDLQNQAILQLLTLAERPAWAIGLKKWDMLRKAFQANHLVAEDFVEDDSTIEQREKAQQPVNPAVELERVKHEHALELEQMRAKVIDEELRMKREIALLDYAKTTKIGLEKVKAMLADTAIKERNKLKMFSAEAQLKMSPQNPTNQGI